MSADQEFRREVEQAMHDDAGLLAAMRALLERAWEFVSEPKAVPGQGRAFASLG